MISKISFSYPWWYLSFCILAGVVYALVMYYRERKFTDHGPWLRRILALVRSLAVTFITLLLLSPFVRTLREEIKKPLIVIANDVSESIKDHISTDKQQQVVTGLNDLGRKLTEKYDVRQVTFGSRVYTESSDSIKDKSTDISKLFRYISDNYADQNLGAVILSTDGIYNEGSNPLYQDGGFTAPVYTVALGDTTRKKDLYFQNVLYNKLAYLGDKFPVQVDISAFNCAGGTTRLTLETVSGGQVKKVSEETININSGNFFTTKTLVTDAAAPGIIRYRLRLSPITGEYITANNVREFFVEVLDARQKILILANAPHPDLAAIKSIITTNKNYEVDITYPEELKGNVSSYSLVIFHNLPSDKTDIRSLISQLDQKNVSRMFFVGMQTNLAKFGEAQNVISIAGNSRNNEEIQAEFNNGFTLFTTSESLRNGIKIFPPLLAPFGEYKAQGTTSTYLYQQIKKIKTNYPLVAFNESNNTKTAVFCGEGIWKWRLFDHLQNKNYDLVNELVNKMVLLTTVKSDKRKFRASSSKSLYRDNDQVLFDAQLFNDNYEMVNEPDVKLSVKDESGKEFLYTFSKTSNYYTLNAGLFPQGSYSYTASVNYSGKALTSAGRFNVESVQLEQFDLTARHGLLKSLSEKYNGTMVYPEGITLLADSLLTSDKIKPVMYQSRSTRPIIYMKWLFFLILGLLSLEWFLRRYFGSY